MSPPITMSFEVACSPEHAFAMWTAKIATWWPRDDTVSAEPDLDIVMDGRVGGRIYERTSRGVEHDWGEVSLWDPPERLAYVWHLRQERSDATEVEIRFVGVTGGHTRVEIEHRGWERLGASRDERNAQNRIGWEALLPHFQAAVARERTSS